MSFKSRKSATGNYPLAEKHPDQLTTPSGIPFCEITLNAVLEGKVQSEDLRLTAEALERQAEIARQVGRHQLAENFLRAAELVNVPEDRILEIYNALRPGRSDVSTLEALAHQFEREFKARRCAQLIREAAEIYARRVEPQAPRRGAGLR